MFIRCYSQLYSVFVKLVCRYNMWSGNSESLGPIVRVTLVFRAAQLTWKHVKCRARDDVVVTSLSSVWHTGPGPTVKSTILR